MSVSNGTSITRKRLAVAVSALLALTGCAATSASGPVTLTTMTPAGPGPLGKVTWNLTMGEPTTIDPAKAGDYSPSTVQVNLCDPLLKLNADYTVSPGLATAWHQPDPLTLVLDLRADVTFWNGHPMTADDVVASLLRQRDPAVQSPNVALLMNVADVAATGKHQVTVRFIRPDRLFLTSLISGFGAVSEAEYLRTAGAGYGTPGGGLMCTGPYKPTEWHPGASITITRNDNYWDSTLKPKAESVEFTFITDSNTLTNALLAGQVDGTFELPTTSARALSKSKVGTVFHGPSTQTLFVSATGPASPLADKRVIDALSLVLDRRAVIDSVFSGAAEPLRTIVPPTVWRNDPAAAVHAAAYAALPDTPPVDVDKARRLVEEAGATGRTINIASPAGDQQSLQILTFLQAGAKKIGLKVHIKQLQPTQMSGLFYDPALRKGYDGAIVQGYVQIPDPVSYMPLMTMPGSLFNWNDYNNPQVTGLLLEAQAAADPQRSAEFFTRAQDIYTRDLPVLTIANPYERVFTGDRVSGVPASAAYLAMPWAAYLGGAS